MTTDYNPDRNSYRPAAGPTQRRVPGGARPTPPNPGTRGQQPHYRAPQSPPYAPSAEPDRGLSFVDKLLRRGARGELIQQPWFASLREEHANVLIGGTVAVLLTLNLLLDTTTSTATFGLVFWHLTFAGLWLAFGYVLAAVATKRAHWLLQWAVCAGGAAGGLIAAWLDVSALEFIDKFDRLAESWGAPGAPTVWFVFDIVLNLATAVMFGYLGVLVHRGLRRLPAQS